MKATGIAAIAALIATTGLVLHMAQAQQVGGRRIDLQRHDLSVTGREVVQTRYSSVHRRKRFHVEREVLESLPILQLAR